MIVYTIIQVVITLAAAGVIGYSIFLTVQVSGDRLLTMDSTLGYRYAVAYRQWQLYAGIAIAVLLFHLFNGIFPLGIAYNGRDLLTLYLKLLQKVTYLRYVIHIKTVDRLDKFCGNIPLFENAHYDQSFSVCVCKDAGSSCHIFSLYIVHHGSFYVFSTVLYKLCFTAELRNSYNILILHSVRYFFYKPIGKRNYALTASVIINKRVLFSIVLSDKLF